MSTMSQSISKLLYQSNKSFKPIDDLIWSDDEEDINEKYIIKQNICNKTYDSDDESNSTIYEDSRMLRDIDDSSLIDREGRLFDHHRSKFSGSVKVDKYIKSNIKITNTKKPNEYKQEFPNVPYDVKFILGTYT